jgi:D-alanine-D-alanine ligase
VDTRPQPSIVVIYNRDFEGAEADPENKARDDIRDIAENIVRILAAAGHRAHGLGVTDDIAGAVRAIQAQAPVVVFNLCESIHGDNRFESLIPLHLDLAGIAYTGSDPFALSLALRKHKVKEVLRARGVATPRGTLLTEPSDGDLDLAYPLIVKPAREDASVGIASGSVVRDPAALAARVKHVTLHYQQPALVEEYVEGREIYVSLLGRLGDRPQVFPFFEIDFSDMPPDRPRIVSFEAKWVEASVEYKGTKPVRCKGLSEALEARIASTALAAFDALELRDYARVDFRLTDDGNPYVIDVNPNCDLSDLAGGYSKAAKAGGLNYRDLILRIVGCALARHAALAEAPAAAARAARASASP